MYYYLVQLRQKLVFCSAASTIRLCHYIYITRSPVVKVRVNAGALRSPTYFQPL